MLLVQWQIILPIALVSKRRQCSERKDCGMQRLKPVLLLLCLLMATSRCVADDSTHVQIQYDAISNGRSSHWDIQLILSGSGTVREVVSGSNSSIQRSFNSGGVLGNSRWCVRSKNQIERVIDNPTHYQLFLVTVNGRSCRATISLRMKPGQKTYTVIGVAGGYVQSDRPRYENVRCAIE
jgi:hypothetical protein